MLLAVTVICMSPTYNSLIIVDRHSVSATALGRPFLVLYVYTLVLSNYKAKIVSAPFFLGTIILILVAVLSYDCVNMHSYWNKCASRSVAK